MCARRNFVSAKRDDQRLNPGELDRLGARCNLASGPQTRFRWREVTANQFIFGNSLPSKATPANCVDAASARANARY